MSNAYLPLVHSIAALGVAGLLLLGTSAAACWAAPPPIVTSTAGNGRFVVETHNETSTVVVYARGRAKELWRVKVPSFSSLFSNVMLTPDVPTPSRA